MDKEERSESELLSLAKFGKLYPDRHLEECTAESFEKALAFCKTAGTYTRYRTMIHAILNNAKGRDMIAAVPKIPARTDKKTKPRKWLTREQWDKLYAQLPDHMKPMAEFSVETGLRQANVLGLQWSRVDIERAFMWVEAEDTKADDAIPVPLSSRAVAILAERHAARVADCVWVFTFRGKPIKDVKTAFIAACVRAEVGHYVDGRYTGFTWHGLRHTWATWHVQSGTPLAVLKELGSWADSRMVENYAHHSAGHLASYANNAAKKKK